MLVERTVAEVKPAVQGNKEQLDLVRIDFHEWGIPDEDVTQQQPLLSSCGINLPAAVAQ